VSATPMAAYIMCECISVFYRATSRKVGFKPAGGMVTSKDAASYYFIVSAVLGKDWLNKGLFRFGVSRMANNLLTDLQQERTVYF
ncbi:MAG: deoxyribose-phosphate aldolase, partial [Muribaculum sp.]|nr:deoxyribose-phosphate aldolase [Candidatus Merdivivens faecigallinarum]